MDNPVFAEIQTHIDSAPVMLFMKGTPMFPQCGFSARVVQILKHTNIPFKSVNVLEDPEIRDGIKEFSNWPTIPQLYVKGEFIGGCDIVTEMYQSGELQSLLSDKGISQDEAA
jgi:monothiol glutaredoxin